MNNLSNDNEAVSTDTTIGLSGVVKSEEMLQCFQILNMKTCLKHYAAVDEEHRKTVANYDLFSDEELE